MPPFAPQYVEAPPVTPLPYGLFSAALVLDPTGEEGNRQGLGVQYEPIACAGVHRTVAACVADDRDPGTVSISVDNTSLATVTAAGTPDGSEDYTIRWGDGTSAQTVVGALSGTTHDYAAPGTYHVFIEGDGGWRASVSVTVTDATATGPFDAEVWFGKATDDGVPLVEGDPFVVYHLHRCRPVGVERTVSERAADALRLGEQRAIEAGFAEQLATMGAVNLTPAGGAVYPVDGVALLEEYAASNYGGIPVIHTPRGIGTVLTTEGTVVRQASRLETVQGAYVASGGGYAGLLGPGEAAPGDGEAWLYVTGVVVVRRLPIIDAMVPEQLRAPVNEAVALAERPVVVTTECIAAAVRVTTGYGVGAA